MIKSFRHKGLAKFFYTGNVQGINPEHAFKVRRILTLLNETKDIKALSYVGFKLHKLKGNRKNLWSVTISGNYRITFEFKAQNAYVLDYLDYH